MTRIENPARWPAALRLDEAAEYSGLSVDTFKNVCPVKPIAFTQSTRGNRYLRASLDGWLLSLDPNTKEIAPVRRFGDRLGRRGLLDYFEDPLSAKAK